ncbi:unnamed protein product [Durusdinium trenchii]|uniref:Uncharacterized protein n=1 Tax=Durusdinium trenchii TaxID=1381693 RepID=A0ABP0S0F2_9DINO
MTAEAEAADEERQNLCLEVLQLYGDPEVFGLCSSLSQERRRHFLSSFQDFLEDKYRDLFLLATSRLRGHPVLGKPDVKASKTPGFEPSIATIRRCRRGSPQSVLYPPGAFGITRPLQALRNGARREEVVGAEEPRM